MRPPRVSAMLKLSPVQVTGLPPITAIAAGGMHGLALAEDGTVWAWGANGSGQLGNGTTTSSTTPVTVHLPPGFTPTAIGAGWFASTGLAIGHEVI